MKHIYALLVLIALLAGATTYSIIKVLDVQAHQNDSLQSIICFQVHLIRSSHRLTATQRATDLRLADRAIKIGHLRFCPK